MAEQYVRVPLDIAPASPRVLPETVGQAVTGVVVNGPIPAGVTFKVCRPGAPDGTVVGGAPSPQQGGDALTGYFCPPSVLGLAVLFTPAVPGGFVDLVVLADDAATVSR